jgi:hypothetical protein
MWSNPYLDIYMGCSDLKKGQSGEGSIMRYWMRDAAGQEALFDWPIADADDFDSITKSWIHIMLTVSPSAIVTYEDGKAVPEKEYEYEPNSLPNKNNLASNGPGRLKPSFKAAAGGNKKIFDFPLDIHFGGRADMKGQRRFLGHLALLKVFGSVVSKDQAMCIFESDEALLVSASATGKVIKQNAPPPPSPSPPKASNAFLTPVVEALKTSADGKHTTYRLSVNLKAAAANIYTIYGEKDAVMTIPAAFQTQSPFGANIGGVNPQFYRFNKQCQWDSWLTVGITNGDGAGNLGTIGLHVAKWDQRRSLTVNDGAVFWMDPALGPKKSAVLAQLTVPKGWKGAAVMNMVGKSAQGSDYKLKGIRFNMG